MLVWYDGMVGYGGMVGHGVLGGGMVWCDGSLAPKEGRRLLNSGYGAQECPGRE